MRGLLQREAFVERLSFVVEKSSRQLSVIPRWSSCVMPPRLPPFNNFKVEEKFGKLKQLVSVWQISLTNCCEMFKYEKLPFASIQLCLEALSFTGGEEA
ncbi:hypothetical protein T07_8354 [Trichinella nelsoni]|uniref:Uncharacterized protein n=1 Tax=Trichinella nelsoni TaxID=6336 RepID=A0A0V0SID2_9BILA|nr:hypothetical protein T07_8354 [Trichinella nelsoni]